MKSRSLVQLASVLLASLLSSCTTINPKALRTVPTNEADCKRAGGDWTSLGISYPGKPKSCDLKARDAGSQCTDSKECEGICLASETTRAGSAAIGQCSPYVRNFGNTHSVEGGLVRDWNIE